MNLRQNLVYISTISGTDDYKATDYKTIAVISTNKESSAIIVFDEVARKLPRWERQE